MKKGLLLSLLLLFGMTQSFGYELVLPHEKNTISNSDYAFFVGKANNAEMISINGCQIYVASNGAFAHSVKLKVGENRIVIRSNYNTQIYKFYKNVPTKAVEIPITEFDTQPMAVIRDNVPLRNTPVDGGLNRIAHLFKDTTLLINGSKGEFYRVFLSKNQTAWIAKKDVSCVKCSNTANFINMDSKKFKNATIQTISFSKNLPYTIEEKDKEILFKVYNPELSENSVYTVNIPKPEKYYYNIDLRDGVYTFKVSELPQALEDITIIVDAGHGGSEKGAIGCLGQEEKDFNLKIALELAKKLKQLGANVIMTRECDGFVSLNDRVEIAEQNDANIFVSIHLNSIGDIPMNIHKNRGTSVYYFNPNSRKLAEKVEKTVTKSTGTRKDGVRTASFAVIRPYNYVGILVETAYMTNPCDSVLYNSEKFASNVAEGIANGIVEFVENE